MNLREFIAAERLILQDPDDGTQARLNYVDSEIVSHAQTQLRSLSRIPIKRAQGFHNFTIAMLGTSGRQVMQSVWEYRLPTWVSHISDVFFMAGTFGTPTMSPQLWGTLPSYGITIRPRKRNRQEQGYTFDHRSLRLWNYGTAPDLLIEVAKTPAPLFVATLDFAPASDQGLYLPIAPAATDLGIEELVEGAYINAEIQVTTTATNPNAGLVRRCAHSLSNQTIGVVRRTSLVFDVPFSSILSIGNVVQSVIPIDDDHMRVLLLRVAWACFEKNAHINGQKAIVDELRREEEAFSDYVTPRQVQEPQFIQPRASTYRAPDSADRDRRYL